MHADAEQMLADFFEQLTVEKRASEHTVKSYQRDIKHLTNYCTDKSIQHWTDLKQSDIRAHIAGRHRKASAVQAYNENYQQFAVFIIAC